MSDVSVSLGVTGKDVVTGAFKDVAHSGSEMGKTIAQAGSLMQESFGSVIGKLAGLAAGFASVSATISAFHAAMEDGGRLADFSDQTGIAVDKLVVLERAFENNGMAADDMGKVVNKMQKFLVEAGESGSTASEKLHGIGLFSAELLKLSPDEQFQKIAETIAAIPDPAQRAAMSMEIFGKSGGKLQALFKDMQGQINQAGEEVGTYASVMKDHAAEFDAMGDGIAAIGRKFTEFAAGALSNVGGGMKEFIEMLKNFDAAGFGKKVTADIATPIKAIADSLIDGNIQQALNLAYELVKLQAMKMGNEISRVLQAAFATVSTFASDVFASSGPIMVSLYNGMKEAREVITKTFREAFLEAGSSAHAWVTLALAAMKLDLPTVLSSFIELKEVHNQFAPAAERTAKSWSEIARESLNAGEAAYKTSGDYFNIATQAEKVQSMSEKIVSEHESMAALTKTIANNYKDWETSLVGVDESFGKWNAGGGEAGSNAKRAGLPVPLKTFDGTGLGPIDTPQPFDDKTNKGGRGSAMSEKDLLAEIMNSLLNRQDYSGNSNAFTNGFMPAANKSYDQLQQIMQTRASQQTASDLSYYTGGDSRASRSQAIDDLTNKYFQDIGGNPADLRKKAEADFNSLMNGKLGGTDANGNPTGPGSAGAAQAQSKSDPVTEISKKVKEIYDHIKSSLPQHALTA